MAQTANKSCLIKLIM